jgi:hypothetical protein
MEECGVSLGQVTLITCIKFNNHTYLFFFSVLRKNMDVRLGLGNLKMVEM